MYLIDHDQAGAGVDADAADRLHELGDVGSAQLREAEEPDELDGDHPGGGGGRDGDVDDRDVAAVVGVALAVDADGVHVGQEDMEPADARRLIGPGKLLGITVHTVDHAREGLGSADHAGLGPVFGSASKDNTDPELGIEGLRRLIGEMDGALPTCAISGIDHSNAAAAIAAGADGVAVISDIFMAEDVEAATRRLRGVVDAALADRR